MEKLHKALEAKHILLLGMGSAVGVGLFLGSAQAIHLAGPAILLDYLIAGLLTFAVLRALGEMTVHEPATGSFSYYATRFISPLAGYMVGWLYWIYWVFVGLAEVTAISIYMGVWFPSVPQWIWALSALAVVGSVNMMPVKNFGEFEYWFSLIKLLTLVFMIALGVGFIFFGIGNGWTPVGISHLWDAGGFMPNGWQGLLEASNMALFAYIGCEAIGLSASEAHQPQKTIPKVINGICWRLLALYLSALFIILCIYPWNQIASTGSPFVAMFESIGLRQGVGIINFVVITAALSSCNAGVFSAGRLLLGLSREQQAPKMFSRLSRFGVPYIAILVTVLIPVLGLVINYYLPEEAFARITAGVTFTGLIVWVFILFTQIAFRRKIGKTRAKKLLFPSFCYPWTTYLAIAFMGLIIFSMGFNEKTRLGYYVLPPMVILLVILYYAYNLHKKEPYATK